MLNTEVPRIHHLLVPGGSEDELRCGEGAVLVYPGVVDVCHTLGNETHAAGMLYDVLAALQKDLRKSGIRDAFADAVLPVVNRRSLEAHLRSKGYTIKGSTALHPISKPAASWVGRLMQGMLRESEELPPQGTYAEFLRIAQHALKSLPGWPTTRSVVLHATCRSSLAMWTATEQQALEYSGDSAQFQIKNGEAVSPGKLAKKGANLLFRVTRDLLHFGQSCELSVDVEYFDRGKGSMKMCYMMAGCTEYQNTPYVSLKDTRTWKTATFKAAKAVLTQSLWSGHDIGFYATSNSGDDFRIRRVVLRPKSLASSGRGHLDQIGAVEHPSMGPIVMLPRTPGSTLPFYGWIVDEARHSVVGHVSLILRGDLSEHQIRAPIRIVREDIVKLYGEKCAKAGFSGLISPADFPPGTYRCHIRLQRQDNSSHIDVDSNRWIKFYDEVPAAPAAT
jgi:hypothetical protein